jgi:hypothetical protein
MNLAGKSQWMLSDCRTASASSVSVLAIRRTKKVHIQ